MMQLNSCHPSPKQRAPEDQWYHLRQRCWPKLRGSGGHRSGSEKIECGRDRFEEKGAVIDHGIQVGDCTSRSVEGGVSHAL